MFEILTWNCRSLYSKLSYFKIRLYAEKPHIACLTETWIKENRLPTFINYTCYFKCRQDRPGGGIAILIRNDLNASQVTLNEFQHGKLEIQAVTIYGNGNKLNIMNIYNPNEIISFAEYDHYFGQLDEMKIIVGDFNAHHNLWDTQSTENSSGHNLADILFNEPGLCLLTPVNFPTYYNVPNRKFSTLDLSIISVDLYNSANIKIGKDLGSDHAPVHIDINFIPDNTPFKRRRKWIFNPKLWDDWSRNLPDREEVCVDMVESYKKFLDNIINTSDGTFKKTKEIASPKYSKPWWNELCNSAVKIRRKKKNRFHRHPSIENLIELRKAEARVKRVCKEAKKRGFREFCSTLNRDTPIKQIWSYIGKLSNKSKKYHAQPLINNNQFITNSKDKAEIIGSYYFETYNVNYHTMNEIDLLVPIALAQSDDESYDYNEPFKIFELTEAIKTLKSSTPGFDHLHNEMLKHMPLDYCKWALDIINLSFDSSIVPSDWKKTIILPILKPNKTAQDPSSYRPISLLPCFAKLAEKLICNRLNYIIERNDSFSYTQGGFRKRMSTIDQVARLENEIRNALYERKHCMAIFFDLSKAYDCVWHLGLQAQLVRCGAKGKILNWIKSFLTEREYSVYHEGEYSSHFKISSGVPQGSIMAPTLFNIMLATIPRIQDTYMAEYADDIVIFYSNRDIKVVEQKVQSQVDSLCHWLKEWGFQLNENKTKGMLFSLCQNKDTFIKINNSPIEFVMNYKYLGMTLDKPRLSWTGHIKVLTEKILKKVNIMKSISNQHWGADRKILLSVYKAIIRSVMDYGSIFYMSAPKKYLDKLTKIQNTCLRLALGARKTSPILSLEVESDIPPLHIHRDSQLIKFYFRLCELPDKVPVTKELLTDNPENYYSRAWSSTIRTAPSVVRSWKYLMSIQFPNAEPLFTSLVSPVPPWMDINMFLCTEFGSVSVKNLSEEHCAKIFKDLKDRKYLSYNEIYTDGSIYDDDKSVSAAVIVVDNNNKVTMNWKLSPLLSIMSAEIFAIYKALEYLRYYVFGVSGVVIFSDSQSGIHLLQNKRPKTNIHMVYKIQSLLIELNRRYPTKIQFIPGHKNIEGNELADLAANAGHNLVNDTESPICKSDRLRVFEGIQRGVWQDYWMDEMNNSGKGLHLFKIKKHVSHWEWTSHKDRTVETALAKLRLGHVGINKHLNRFNLRDDDKCSCGVTESIEHFLFQCPIFATARTELYHTLSKLNVEVNIRNLLGGGKFCQEKQKIILNETIKYLRTTNKLWDL